MMIRCRDFQRCRLWLVLLSTVLSVVLVDGTIYAGNETFESLPGLIGLPWKPPEQIHKARLQFLESNPMMCHEDAPLTNDNEYPVALLVSRGNCSFALKGANAYRMDPSSVQYVLIYDDVPHSYLVPMSGNSEEADRVFMLFISHETGIALRYMLREHYSQNASNREGMLIRMNGIGPPMDTRAFEETQRWLLAVMAGMFSFIAFFGCLLVFIQAGLIPNSRLVVTLQQTTPSARTVLSLDQLQALPEQPPRNESATDGNHGNSDQQDAVAGGATSSCAVCLEDFNDGSGGLRTLPCQHTFHSECIVPWLTERHASCPLCKFDVLEHLTQASADENVSSTSSWLWSLWNWRRLFPSRRGYIPAQNPGTRDPDGSSSSLTTMQEEDVNQLELVAEIPATSNEDQPIQEQ